METSLTPVRPAELDTVPVDFGAAQQLVEAQPEALLITRTQQPETMGNEFPRESMEVLVAVEEVPVEPAGLIIVAIGIVVSGLAAPRLVSHRHHRYADRKHRDHQKIPYLSGSQCFDGRVVRWPFHAAIPAAIVVRAIAIVLAVRLVVLGLVGNKVVQREAVMASDEIDALLGLSFLMCVDIGAAQNPVRHPSDRSGSARKKERTSSRNLPFHSFQLSPMKLPTW